MNSQKPEAGSQKSEEKNASLIESVKNRFPDAVLSSHTYRGDATLVLNGKFLLEVARFLKEDPAFLMNFLVDVSAVDYSTFGTRPTPAFFNSSGVTVKPDSQIPDEDPWPGPPNERFTVVYHFYSMTHKHRLRLVVPVDESAAEVDSLVALWPAANWLERNLPALDRASVVHGDYRAGNFLFDEASGRITAILDWELVHLGDPLEDLGWICMRSFRGRSPHMCHLIERARLYERAARQGASGAAHIALVPRRGSLARARQRRIGAAVKPDHHRSLAAVA